MFEKCTHTRWVLSEDGVEPDAENRGQTVTGSSQQQQQQQHPLLHVDRRGFPAPLFCFPRVESAAEWRKRCRTFAGYKSSRMGSSPVPPSNSFYRSWGSCRCVCEVLLNGNKCPQNANNESRSGWQPSARSVFLSTLVYVCVCVCVYYGEQEGWDR